MKRQTKFSNLGAAAKFYGMGRAQFMELRALGLASKDLMPINDPAAMVEWFDRQHAKGKRRTKCPDGILARAAEVRAITKKGRKLKQPVPPVQKKAKDCTENAAPPVQPPMVMGEEATEEDMLASEKQLFAAYNERFLGFVRNGEEDTAAGRLAGQGREKSMARILNLSKGAKTMRESGDFMRTGQVKLAAMEFANGVFLFLRRELPALFEAKDHERVMSVLDTLADRLPAMLPAEFAE